jgi:hypothetical protein
MKHGRNEQDVKNELQERIQTRNVQGKMLYEKWQKTDICREVSEKNPDIRKVMESNPSKAVNIARALNNQERYLQTLSESVISTNFSVRPENLLRAVKIGVANSNRGDFATEYPLQTTDDAIFYIWMTYESALRGSAAGQKIYENINQFYAGEQAISSTLATGNGVTTNFTLAPVSPLPIIRRTISIIVDGAIVAKDDGDGTLSDFTSGTILDTSSTNTVDYDTGVVVLNFAVAPANGAPIQVMYNWSSEDSDNFASMGTVGISIEKKRFNARPMPLGYSYSAMTQITFETTGLGNAEELLMMTVGDEHAKSRDYKAIQRMRQIAKGNALATFNADFAAEGEVSLKSHAQNITKAIGEVSATIYDDIKRGQINKAIVGSKVLPFLKLHDLWVDDLTQPRSGVYKAGRLSDIDIFVCPNDTNILQNDELLLTYKNPQEGLDLSVVFGVLTEIDAALKYPEFYTKGYKATVEDSIVINTKFCRLMQLQNINPAA